MLDASLKPVLDVLAESNRLKAFRPGRVENTYFEAFITSDFTRIFLNSVIITGSVVALGTLINSMAGPALALVPFKGQRLVLAFVVAIYIVPFPHVAIPPPLLFPRAQSLRPFLFPALSFISRPSLLYP